MLRVMYSGSGSSPRARGTAGSPPSVAFGGRFIPACAGNSSQTKFTSSACPVHPRVRGEQGDVDRRVVAVAGSSPRARGTGGQVLGRAAGGRFIPAYAGNRRRVAAWSTAATVHPRVRGEQGTAQMIVGLFVGSSPRARGTAGHLQRRRRQHRFIPACAGNRAPSSTRSAPAPVHPRVRGEQHLRRDGRRPRPGSSPRARGTAHVVGAVPPLGRFIPACAGNRRATIDAAANISVHPRVRGEQFSSRLKCACMVGSSPRARGTDPHSRAKWDRARFIPACAGNSGLVVGSPSLPPVHPRVRGEQGMRSAGGGPKTGSSPRARGTEEPADEPHQAHRFIPACAGNRSSASRPQT